MVAKTTRKAPVASDPVAKRITVDAIQVGHMVVPIDSLSSQVQCQFGEKAAFAIRRGQEGGPVVKGRGRDPKVPHEDLAHAVHLINEKDRSTLIERLKKSEAQPGD